MCYLYRRTGPHTPTASFFFPSHHMKSENSIVSSLSLLYHVRNLFVVLVLFFFHFFFSFGGFLISHCCSVLRSKCASFIIDPFRTAVPFWGQATWSLSGFVSTSGLQYRKENPNTPFRNRGNSRLRYARTPSDKRALHESRTPG